MDNDREKLSLERDRKSAFVAPSFWARLARKLESAQVTPQPEPGVVDPREQKERPTGLGERTPPGVRRRVALPDRMKIEAAEASGRRKAGWRRLGVYRRVDGRFAIGSVVLARFRPAHEPAPHSSSNGLNIHSSGLVLELYFELCR